MNSNAASKTTNVYSDSNNDSNDLIGLPVFDDKNEIQVGMTLLTTD